MLPRQQHNSKAVKRFIPLAMLLILTMNLEVSAQFQIRINTPQPKSLGGFFPRNRELSRILGKAENAIQQKQYSEAVNFLQTILNAVADGADAFIVKPSVDDSSQQIDVSVRAEAYLLLASLPVEGRQAYELMSGQTAKEALTAGIDQGNIDQIEDVARRYFLTKAGREAGMILGRLHMDRNEYVQAALQYSRLQRYYDVAPEIQLRTALCWASAEMPHSAIDVLTRLQASTKSVTVRDRDVQLFADGENPVQWLESALQTAIPENSNSLDDWYRPFGNASRNATSAQMSTLGDALWSASSFGLVDVSGSISTQLDQFAPVFSDRLEKDVGNQIPAAQPIVVGDLAIFRAFGKLQAIDLESGELEWESATLDPLIPEAFRSYTPSLSPRRTPPVIQAFEQRAWNDLTSGTISTDGRHVFSIEEIGTSRRAISILGQQPGVSGDSNFNLLRAYDVVTGKTVWNVGGKLTDGSPQFAGHFFLGPPLVLGDRIYVLAELREQILLLALREEQDADNRWTVRSDWTVVIANSMTSGDIPTSRRFSGLSPTYSDGKLICPTAAGAYVAVDLVDRMPVWGYQYSSNSLAAPTFRTFPTRTATTWQDSNARVAGDYVLLTPNDLNEIHCLEVSTGRRLWTQKQQNRRYIATVDSERILIVGRNRVEAIETKSGNPLWEAWLADEITAGIGVAEGDRYHVPLASGKVATLNSSNGRILSIAGEIAPGNLVATNTVLLSQSPTSLVAYPSHRMLADHFAAADGADPRAQLDKAVFELQRGEVDASLVILRKVIESGQETEPSTEADSGDEATRARSLLRNTLLAGLRVAGNKLSDEKLDELGVLLKGDTSPDARDVMWQFASLKKDRLLAKGQFVDAFQQVLGMSGDTFAVMKQVDAKRQLRLDRWIYSNIQKIVQQASAEQRAELNQFANAKLKSLTDDGARLSSAVTVTPTLSVNRNASDDEQRLANTVATLTGLNAADALQAEWMQLLTPQIHPLQLETALLHRRSQPESRPGATLQLAKLYATQNRYDLVEPLLNEIRTQFPNATIAADDDVADDDAAGLKAAVITGRDLADRIANGSKAKAELALIQSGWDDRQVVAKEVPRRRRISGVGRAMHIPFARSNTTSSLGSAAALSPGNAFAGWSFRWDSGQRKMMALDSLGRLRWETRIRHNDVPPQFDARTASILTAGHLVLVQHSGGFVALDGFGIHPEELWSQSYRRSTSGGGAQVVSLSTHGLLYATATELVFADPLTGQVLWRRDAALALPVRCVVNERYAIFPSFDGHLADVFDLFDGQVRQVVLKNSIPESLAFDARFLAMIRRAGGAIPTVERRSIGSAGPNVVAVDRRDEKIVINATNLIDDSVSWSADLGKDAVVSTVADGFVALFDRNAEGQQELRVHNAMTGEQVVSTPLNVDSRPANVAVLVSSSRFVVIVNHGDGKNSRFAIPAIFRTAYGINGTIFTFDRTTKKLLWQQPVVNKTLVRDHSAELPILVFFYKVEVPNVNGNVLVPAFRRYQYAVTILDARTGDEIFASDNIGRSLSIAQIGIEEPAGTMSVQMMSSTIMLGSEEVLNRIVKPEIDDDVPERGVSVDPGGLPLDFRDAFKGDGNPPPVMKSSEKKPVSKKPVSKKPVSKNPVSEKPGPKLPTSKKPAAKAPTFPESLPK